MYSSRLNTEPRAAIRYRAPPAMSLSPCGLSHGSDDEGHPGPNPVSRRHEIQSSADQCICNARLTVVSIHPCENAVCQHSSIVRLPFRVCAHRMPIRDR